MADYIYSELINNLVSLNFDGVSNENAEIHVDNLHRLIEAIIKKTPGSLTIVDPSGRESIFDGSQDISITLSDRHLKSVKVNQCEKDNTPIEGLLVGDYYFDFEMIDRGNGYIYHLYCSAKVLTSLVDDEKERAINRENEIERNLNQEIARAQQEEINLNNYIDSAISSVYKAQGSATVGDLNSLTVTKEMNGYVYDISDNGILTKGSIQVINGDNVIIIWNEDETDWKWDKLSGIVDLSNYATKPYVTEGLNKKVSRSSTTSGEYIYGIANGIDKEYPLQKQVGYNGIVQRTENGNIVVPLTPASDDCATSKQYVDNGLETKMNVFLEVSSFLNLPAVGSTSTFYVTVDNNKLYRWTGSTYIEVGNSKVITTNTPTKFRNYTQEVYNYPYMQSLASDGKYIFGIMSKWAEQGRDIVACSYDLNGNLIATKELNELATLEQCCGLTVKDGKLIIFQNGGVEKSVTINVDGTFGANWEVYTGFKFAEINSTTPLQDVVYSKNLNRLYVKPYDFTDTVYIYANDATTTTNNTLLGTFKLKTIDGVNFTRMTITDNCVFANYTSNGIMYPLIAVYTIDGEYLYTSNISYTPEEASVGIDFPEGETFDVEHSNTQGILYINDSIYFTSISFSTGYLGHKSAIVKCTLINDSKQLILGETGSTAYPGNKGKANADNIKSLQETKADITYVDNGLAEFEQGILDRLIPTIDNKVDLSSDQTITGVKTFKDEIDLQYSAGAGDVTWKVKAAGDYSFYIQRNDDIWFNLITTQGLGLDYTFYPINTGKDLGKSASPWNDLYLSGGVKIGSGNIWYNGSFYINDDFCSSNDTISLGKKTTKWKDGYFSGQVYAENTFNVINASDIVDDTLTQEQYDLITNGKPTLIKGVYGNYEDTFIFPTEARTGAYTLGMFLGRADSNGQNIGGYYLHNTNRKLYYYAQSDRVNRLGGIKSINGKDVPAYPSNTGTFNLKQIDGTLTWTKEWYGTQAEYDALGTYDNNTIYNIIEE